MELSITLILVILNCIISIPALSSPKITDDLIFSPVAVTYQKQWYRFMTSGFIHVDFIHLAFNMLALWSFGRSVESGFIELFGSMGKILYATMYLLALVVSLLPTYFSHKEDSYYRSLGASGAVSAVVFAGLMLNPLISVGIMFIPIPIKGYIFGPLFLIISGFLGKSGRGGNVNHSAHIWGALFGIIFLVGAAYIFTDYPLLQVFVQRIRSDIGF